MVNRKILLLLIVILGFGLRYYGATSIPPAWDEIINEFPDAQKISFSPENINLPIVDKTPEGGVMVSKYIIVLGWYLFGNSVMGARLPFILLGTFNIILIYLLVKQNFNTPTALISALLFSISQYSIGGCRFSDSQPCNIMMVILSLIVFCNAIKRSSKWLIMLNGLIMGVAFWFYENLIFLVPIYIIFLLLSPDYRYWLKSKYLWISFAITFFVAVPLVILNLAPGAERFGFIYNEATIGFSLNATGMYLGEIILLAIKPFANLFDFVAGSLDSEKPPVNFVLGILILFSVARSFKDKHFFVRLLVICFMFHFVAFSLVRRNDVIQSVWSLGSLDWGNTSFIPGVILLAILLYKQFKNRMRRGLLLLSGLVFFMLIKTWNFVSYPMCYFFPVREFFLEGSYDDIEYYRSIGQTEYVKDILISIFRATRNEEIKQRAVLELSEVLINEVRNETVEECLPGAILEKSGEGIANEKY